MSPNTHPEAVLCDLDGTLLDSNAQHAWAWQKAFEHFGISTTFDQVIHQIGKGGDNLIPVFVPESDRGRLQKPLEDYRKQVLGPGTVKVAIEAGCREGWDRYIGSELLGPAGAFIGMHSFGASGPYKDVYAKFGITTEGDRRVRLANAAIRLGAVNRSMLRDRRKQR